MNLKLFKQKYNISFCITNRNLGIEQNAILVDFLTLSQQREKSVVHYHLLFLSNTHKNLVSPLP